MTNSTINTNNQTTTEKENEQLRLTIEELNSNFINDSWIAENIDRHYDRYYTQYYSYYETINFLYEHPEYIASEIYGYETRIEKLEKDNEYLDKKLIELENLVPYDGESIEDLRYENELLRLETQNLQEENEELRNTNIADREIRMLRQTIRQQMQTIASLQMQLNQNRINRDSFNPMEDIEE